ncbi:hypothetical protein [Alkalihalobacterium alkalinitrilicum]|uniref:hypothetical protein n=1 Tax=Alkalihalobacterium alkalinitrilicum TaxID=427920 RepID=UPI0009951C18|nr:hypothetical protein [Alkalihalobacterium alkalinitrilicum]
MQFFKIILFFSIVFVLASCGPQVEIQGDVDQSKVIIDEDRNLLTFYVRLENTSNLPSGNLFAKFELLSAELIEELGQETIPFVNENQIPEAFKISANSGYFIGESFEVEQIFTEETLADAVEVVIFDEDGDDVTRFSITHVEMETN